MVHLLVVSASVVSVAHPVVNQQIVDKIKSSGAHWETVEPSQNRFGQMSEDELKGLMGTVIDVSAEPRKSVPSSSSTTYPREFDARETFASCRHPIRNQLKCGSCWAFSVAETWADNACILGLADNTTVFSVEEVLSCATFGSGECGGGRINYAFDYVRSDGLVHEACMPYTSANGTVGPCPPEVGPDQRTCLAPNQVWNATVCKTKLNDLFTPDLMKEGIMKLGAIATGFTVFEDFMNYKMGIYHHVSGKMLGGHAIKVIGWGVLNATATDPELPYWIVANSWGAEWGESGYFRFSMNDTDCHFGVGGAYNCGINIP